MTTGDHAMTTFLLTGKKNICNFVGRSWKTVEEWIVCQDFPARKLNGVWESDSELITQWRRKKICQEQKLSPERS